MKKSDYEIELSAYVHALNLAGRARPTEQVAHRVSNTNVAERAARRHEVVSLIGRFFQPHENGIPSVTDIQYAAAALVTTVALGVVLFLILFP